MKIVGRSKDMVIRGGENVYPREIEEYLYTHPDVADVQVVGVPDERYGEEIAAFVIVRDGAALDTDAVRAFCEGRIAHYKIPRHVLVVTEFPMTISGKVQKFKLRDAAIEAARPRRGGRDRLGEARADRDQAGSAIGACGSAST